MVKALSGMIAFVAHVPLAEEGSLIARFLQQLRKINNVFRLRSSVVYNGVTVRIHPRQNGSPAWGTQGRRDVCVPDMHAFRREPVQPWRLEPRYLLHKTHGIVAVIICNDEDDILLLTQA